MSQEYLRDQDQYDQQPEYYGENVTYPYADVPTRSKPPIYRANWVKRSVIGIGSAVLAGAVFASCEADTIASQTPGRNALRETYIEDVACFGGYVTDVDGASAHYEKDVKVDILGFTIGTPGFVHPKITDTASGTVDTEICLDQKRSVDYQADKGKLFITIPKDGLFVRLNNDLTFHRDGNIVQDAMDAFKSDLKVVTLSIWDDQGTQDNEQALDKLAAMAADKGVIDSCGPLAWNHIKDSYYNKIRQNVLMDYNSKHADKRIDVDSNDPAELAKKVLITNEGNENVPFAEAYNETYNDNVQKLKDEGGWDIKPIDYKGDVTNYCKDLPADAVPVDRSADPGNK